jgi:hypothetical protein
MPTNAGGGAIDNLHSGGTTINCPAGSGLQPGQLTLIAVNVLGTGVTITPPSMGSGIPPWQQLGSTITVGNYEQALFWHEVGTAPSENAGSFTFMLSPSSRAACVGVTYTNTCLMSASACTDPIFDYNSGSAALSNSVATSGTSSPQGKTSGQLAVPPLGVVVGFYGSSDPFSEFGIAANPSCNSNGGVCPNTSGTFSAGMTGPVVGRFQTNGGIDAASKNFSSATDGPFGATLPLRQDPTGSLLIQSITGNGTTASGLTTSANTLLIGSTQGYVTGNSNSGFNIPSGSVLMTTNGNQNFSYSNPTNGSGTGGNLFLQDPAAGDAVAQAVSIIPQN